ncbi:cell division protein ZapE [Mesorhizobium sp. YM1C-6-2]|uniref:cell division protein ZapE n=1 Tax=Mesorhizobium sp. YM1C-6-2 TaxID=1827501 RepID=UPI000EF1CBED|nr:cell division protein ZapE [Mesorhizobium sp. YM1C-6-2]RLP25905.1 AFG1 family ATPase [Mesorhizobium sp. YM1C-6-2]
MHLRDGLQPHSTVAQRYAHLAETGEIAEDPAQRPVVSALDHLIDEIRAKRLARKSSALGWLFAKNRAATEPVTGLYVHGGVGRGKTMLMDLFFDTVPVRRKRRVHFNDFMADAHDRIQKHRQARKEGTVREDDPIPPVARALAEEAWVLCFDEFSVTDIADAMILSRLFSALFANGVVLVATSNLAPDDLYRDGLNRQLFLPFVALLKRHARVIALDSETDYRMEKLNRLPVYMTPLSAETDRRMDEAWGAVTRGTASAPDALTVKGRQVAVPIAAGEAARFSFAELCEKPLGARDYLAIVDRFGTIFVDHVPVLDQTLRNPAKRFILLIDTLYDKRARLVLSAAAPPDRLYAGRAGVTEAFEFDRTVSRLIEMQSREWLDEWSERRGDPPKAAASGS